MRRIASIHIVGLAAALSALAGCTDRVVFVTGTDIGINADATQGTASIGYDRTEGVFGPAYVDTGALPQTVASMRSDLGIFNPHIRQVYATGKAAVHVTRIPGTTYVDPEADKDKVPPLTGMRRAMFFGTTTNIGVRMGFTAQGPDSINFGYKRKELSIIPLRPDLSDGKPDVYPSVLAAIDMNLTPGVMAQTGLQVNQFIATGTPAEIRAQDDGIRRLIRAEQAAALSAEVLGRQDAARQIGLVATIVSCVKKVPGALDSGSNARLRELASAGKINSKDADDLLKQTSTAALTDRLNDVYQHDVTPLFVATEARPEICDK